MRQHLVDLGPSDVDELLRMNRAAVPAVGDVDAHRMTALLGWASLAIGVRDGDGSLVGFVICLVAGSDYDSPNYRFFDARYDDFVYVDRVVVAESARSTGLGTRLYDEVVARSPRARLMTAEVNLVPPNPGSMRFHERRGFLQVGVMEDADATHRVRLMAADLGG